MRTNALKLLLGSFLIYVVVAACNGGAEYMMSYDGGTKRDAMMMNHDAATMTNRDGLLRA